MLTAAPLLMLQLLMLQLLCANTAAAATAEKNARLLLLPSLLPSLLS